MRNPKRNHSICSVKLDFDPLASASIGAVTLSGLDSSTVHQLARHTSDETKLHDLLCVTVSQSGSQDQGMTGIVGRHELLNDGVRFTPHFPFQAGLGYRAIFNPKPLGSINDLEVLTYEFSLPKLPATLPTVVKQVFPSAESLPENLLRFYISFSNSMQRGSAQNEIVLLGPDGRMATDVLYRAPVELWDRRIEHLTVLLDPGRLKRGVGPNRDLGAPLQVGQMYTLVVGRGMLDMSGRPLTETFYKQFCVTEAVRAPISVEDWKITPPAGNSFEPLILLFPRPLDWALLRNAIAILCKDKQLHGKIVISQCEQSWSFIPAVPWVSGFYDIRVSTSLEDVSGNSILAAFDRPIRLGSDLQYEVASGSIGFCVK